MNVVDVLKEISGLRCLSGVTEKTLHWAERRLLLSFAPEYREYLLMYGLVSANGHELTGICDFPRLNVVDVTLECRKTHNVPSDFYVVEEALFDDIVVWQSTDGLIYESVPGKPPRKVCSSLGEHLLR
ncbi:MAG TPA: SMI1/KNR4 family protein [Candidatus Olsenella pullicola]|nr:SMI1/KNR4 family protein [Candidatus Olsenella pullicola]